MLIFYTNYEGGPLFSKELSKKEYVNLLKNVNLIRTTESLSLCKLLGMEIHSIQVPKIPNSKTSISQKYHRWDTINGWNNDVNISYLGILIECANSNQT